MKSYAYRIGESFYPIPVNLRDRTPKEPIAQIVIESATTHPAPLLELKVYRDLLLKPIHAQKDDFYIRDETGQVLYFEYLAGIHVWNLTIGEWGLMLNCANFNRLLAEDADTTRVIAGDAA